MFSREGSEIEPYLIGWTQIRVAPLCAHEGAYYRTEDRTECYKLGDG